MQQKVTTKTSTKAVAIEDGENRIGEIIQRQNLLVLIID